METIANFIVSAIRWVGRTQRRCTYSQAIGAPVTSTMVETAGTSPSTMSAESSLTNSDAWLLATPTPPAIGNSNAAVSTPASRQNRANRTTADRAGGY